MKLTENRLYIIVFTFLFSFVFIFILALVNGFTKDIVTKNGELLKMQAILGAMDVTVDTTEDISTVYSTLIGSVNVDGVEIYRTDIGGGEVIAVEFIGNGLWGTITGILAVNSEITRIVGLTIITHNETPGLGGRIEEEWFGRQFRGELITDSNIIFDTGSSGKGNYNSEDGKVDAITGASRTSEYLQIIIIDTLVILQQMREGGVL